MRKILLTILFLGACGQAEAQQLHKFVPDNDLWKEDNLTASYKYTDESTFNRIINIGQQLYNATARQYGETLTFVRLWQDPTVNASAWKDGRGNTEVTMYGGMARRPEVLPLSFALVMCHELNHLYGAAPYLDSGLRISAEGQSDWAGAGWCLQNVAAQLGDATSFPQTTYMQNMCGCSSPPPPTPTPCVKQELQLLACNQTCLQALGAANGLGTLLSRLNGEPVPNFETPDRTIVSRTELSYPRTIQCRLDSYHNGTLSLQRPKCWFAR